MNQICETALEIPENHGPSDAPVSYPFLWDTPRLDWVQWNGSVSSVIERNVGEVLGVFAHLQLTGTPETGQFTSTANIQNLDRLEQMLADLSAPPWPADILGPIDQTKAARGKELYAANCAMCHHERIDGQFPLTDPNEFGRRFIRTKMITAFPPDKDKIGTDPTMVANFAHRLVDPGPLRPHLPEEMREQPKVHAAIVLRVAVMAVVTRKLHEAGVPEDEIEEQIVALSGGRDPHALPPNIAGYKARPLNGIWATAPYLHNGSVPSLYQLLLPEDQRVKSFHVGDGQFDPVHVGYRTEKSPGSFEFRAVTADGQPIRGNSNLGHSGKYYTQAKQPDDTFRNFTDEERWALVEYMKKLQ